MTNEERAALELIAFDAAQAAEDRNAAIRALAEPAAADELPSVDAITVLE